MLKNLFYTFICVPLGLVSAAAGATEPAAATRAYDFTFTSITGEPLKLAQFDGQPILVVNTASECGFTPQYAGLQELHERYAARGLVILAVPSNDFGGQEPGDSAQIQEFCQVEYGAGFLLAAKEQVKGKEAHPFYRWARAEKGVLAAPKWNFHKYLIGRDGKIAEWFASTTAPESPAVIKAVEEALAQGQGQGQEQEN